MSYYSIYNSNSLDLVTATQKLNLDFVPVTCQEYTLNNINQTFTEEAFNMIISGRSYYTVVGNSSIAVVNYIKPNATNYIYPLRNLTKI